MRPLFTLALALTLSCAAQAHGSDSLQRTFISGKFYKIQRGRVIPLKNSTVCVKGTRLNTVTDAEGRYTLDITVIADTVKTLVVSGSLADHDPQEYVVNEPVKKTTTVVNFEMQPSSTAAYYKK